MNNIPENENLNNAESLQDDFSTIFSNPTEHKKTADDFKKKKLLPKIIACFLAVAILAGGTFAVIKFIPEKQEETSSTPAMQEIEVLSLNSDELKEITIYNNNGTFKLYSVEDKTETTTSDSSSTTKTVNWYVNGYKKEILSTASVGSIASSVATITASREVTERTAADCGLEKSKIKATIVENDGKTTAVILGDQSPDKSGYYLKLDSSDKIYVVDSSLKETLNFTPVSLAETNILPAFPLEDISSTYKTEEGALSSFDKLTISGKNISEPLVITPILEEAAVGFSTYKIISPTIRVASDNLSAVIEIFKSGVSVSGAYSLDTSAKTLDSLGLNKPDFEAKMEIEGKVHFFKFSLQPDGGYAAISNDSQIVKKVDAQTLTFADKQSSYFYSDWVAINFIDDLKNFTFVVGDKVYDFGIKANPDTEAEDKYIVTYNGKTLKSAPFQSFYQDCISIKCSDFTVDKVNGKPDYKIIFTYKEGKGNSETVEFTSFSATKYQYSVNGEALGKVSVSTMKSLENSLNTLLK